MTAPTVTRDRSAPPADVDWRQRGACRNNDPELFFETGTGAAASRQIEAAKAVCRHCPVRAECLTWALESGQDFGVWGGMSDRERRKLRRSLPVVPS